MVLKRILLATLIGTAALPAAAAGPTIGADNVQGFIGKEATVCGKVDSAKYNENSEGQPTFMHMGGKFPAHKFAIRILGENRGKFSPVPEENIGKMVCASGKISRAAGNRAEMTITDPGEMQIL